MAASPARTPSIRHIRFVQIDADRRQPEGVDDGPGILLILGIAVARQDHAENVVGCRHPTQARDDGRIQPAADATTSPRAAAAGRAPPASPKSVVRDCSLAIDCDRPAVRSQEI
jgi:hypothetical protein